MQLVSLRNRGPNLTAFQFWATVGLGQGNPPDEPFIGFGFDTGLSGRPGQAGAPRAVLSIPSTGNASHALNGKTFNVILIGQVYVFELSDDGSVTPGNFPVTIVNNDTAAAVAAAIENAVVPDAFGFESGGATARTIGVLPDGSTGVLIEAAENSTHSAMTDSPLIGSATFDVAAGPPLAAQTFAGGTYGAPLLGTASKAFVFSGLTNSGDLPTVDGNGNPVTLLPQFLTIIAWPIPRGAGGVRAWIPQLVPQAFTQPPG